MINSDLDNHIKAKTNDKSPTFRRHLGAIVKGDLIEYAISRVSKSSEITIDCRVEIIPIKGNFIEDSCSKFLNENFHKASIFKGSQCERV